MPLLPGGVVLLPLRAFLGFTFSFAGLQKLANPGFLDASNPASIQAQLAGAARSSPIHALITPLAHQAVALGLLIAFGELAVGLGTLLGLYTRIAAAGGLALSLLLFMTVSFHSHPYYTGSDIVFAFAWTPLLLAGPSVLSADAVLRSRGERRAKSAAASHGRAGIDRRTITGEGAAVGLAAVAALTLGGLTAILGRLLGGSAQPPGVPTLGAGTRAASPPASPATQPAAGKSSTRPAGAAARRGPGSARRAGFRSAAQPPSPTRLRVTPHSSSSPARAGSLPSTPSARTPGAPCPTSPRSRCSSARVTARSSTGGPAPSSPGRRRGAWHPSR